MALKPLKDIPEWWELCARYRYDIYAFAVEALGVTPTWQQELLFESIQFDGSRTSVASGHGCFGKGTKIRLANGKWKRVEKITINDAVMGTDGFSPREVIWSGMPFEEAKQYYDKVYALGTLSTAHFGVWLEPYDENGKIAQESVELIDAYDLSHPEAGMFNAFENGEDGFLASTQIESIPLMDNTKLPWLCQSIDLSLLDALTDSVQVGTFQLNHITGNGSGEISIPFIETRNASILNSALAIKEIMFPKGENGGTQALPKDYLMRMTVYIYDKHSYSTRVFEVQHLVALQTGSIPLDATNKNGIGIVTLNFIKMFPMLP